MIPERYDDPLTPDVDEGEARDEYIREVVRDARHAGLTAQDIVRMVNEIRAGMDHQDNYYEEGDNQFPRVTGQYGHAPGAEGASLETFVDAGEAGVAVLVQARGVSKGIADAAVDDIAGIRAVIARIHEYIDKARDAKSALEDEVARLRNNEIPRVTREAADKRAAAAALQSPRSTLKCNT